MARKASTPKSDAASGVSAEPQSITITYDLFDLPTAQHKAGLAGLLLQIDSMKYRKKSAPEYVWDEQKPTTKVTVTFTEEAICSLFDDLYAAEVVEVRVKSKWPNATLIREEETEEVIEDKTKKVKRFVYEVVQPTGNFLKQYITNAPDAWLKLWQDMLWAIPRGNPQSRQPFEQRSQGMPCKEGPSAWEDLLKAEKAKHKQAFHTTPVAGSLWLGAQSTNAENISFDGRVEQTILLHFWCLTAMVFVPQAVSHDGDSEFVGFTLAIPGILDLEGFLDSYGVPFLGDNAFLLDRIVVVGESVPVRWFEQLDSDSPGMKDHVTRLTVQINRADLSQTRSGLFAPGEPTYSSEPPSRSWVTITSLTLPVPVAKPKARSPKAKPVGDG